jgi:ATP-dependent Clp protease ATP-binding subunit ClpC
VFERFTEPARQVVIVAEQEARDAGQRKIGTEHLLLGMLVEGQGLAAQASEVAPVAVELR